MTAHHYNKIILTLMIKNESKIIERCMSNALEHVDAINILDTGSTDETVTICEKYLSGCGKPYKISVEPFKNFAYNRTISFQKAQELCKELKWDGDSTFSLAVDADMPAHRHGMNYRASVTALGDGRFRADGLMFHMAGRWRILFDLPASDVTPARRISHTLDLR